MFHCNNGRLSVRWSKNIKLLLTEECPVSAHSHKQIQPEFYKNRRFYVGNVLWKLANIYLYQYDQLDPSKTLAVFYLSRLLPRLQPVLDTENLLLS